MTRLLGDLVDVASIEGGRFEVVPDTSDAKALVRDTLEAFRPAAPPRESRWLWRRPTACCWRSTTRIESSRCSPTF